MGSISVQIFRSKIGTNVTLCFSYLYLRGGNINACGNGRSGQANMFRFVRSGSGSPATRFFFLSVTLFSRALLFLSFGCLRALPTTRREIRLGEQPVGEITAIKGSLPNTPGEDLTFIRTHTCMPQLEPLKPGCSVNAASLRCNGSCATDPERGLPRRDCGSRVLANTRGRYT